MKIWIDITNAPHVAIWKPFISHWEDSGHEVFITARDLSNTIDLLDLSGWNYVLVGGHAGKRKYLKSLYFPVRVIKLALVLRKVKPNVGVSHSSFYSPLAGKLSGIRTVYLNDNEHAKGNLLAFLFATTVIVPHCLSHIIKGKNIKYYRGVKEGFYSVIDRQLIDVQQETKIYFRPEPDSAEYYKEKFNHDILETLKELSKIYDVIVLPRSRTQYAKYCDYFQNTKVQIAQKPVPFNQIVKDSKLFFGAGGSMTRELACNSKRVISLYSGDLLEVDKYLISLGLMVHFSSIDLNEIRIIIENDVSVDNLKRITLEGKWSYALINETIIKADHDI